MNQAGHGGAVNQAGVSDEGDIARLLYRYARAVDTKDWELYCSVFTDDAYIDYSSAGAAAGSRDEVADWYARPRGGGAVISARRTSGSSTRQPALRNHTTEFVRVASDNIATCRTCLPRFDNGHQASTAGHRAPLSAHAVPVATRARDRR